MDEKSLMAELAILAAMLLNDGEMIPKVTAQMSEDDFYRAEHRILYRHIMRLWQEGITPNLITLRTSLKKTDELEKVGAALLVSLGDLEFTTAYIDNHISIVKEKAQYRRINDLIKTTQFDVSKQIKEPSRILDEIEQAVKKIRLGEIIAKPSGTFVIGEYINGAMFSEISNLKRYTARVTGFDNIDENQIFAPGLYLLGGLPALGKTTFAWQLLYQLALRGEQCIYCSYEMSRLELSAKLFSSTVFTIFGMTDLTSTQIIRGAESPKLEEAKSILSEQPLNNLTVFELRDETIDVLLRILKQICVQKYKSPVVCLDYLQIVPHRQDNAKAGIDDIVRKLKNFQRETNTTFIVISSFNRANYTQTVSFESFKESGNIEYSADVVWGLQLECMNHLPKETNKAREEIEKSKRETPRRVQLRCLKNRKGTNYDCYFNYYAAHDHFEITTESYYSDIAENSDDKFNDYAIGDDILMSY